MKSIIATILVAIMVVATIPQMSNSFRINGYTKYAEATGGVIIGEIGIKTKTVKTWLEKIIVSDPTPDNITVVAPNKNDFKNAEKTISK